MANDVFISYRGPDRNLARRLQAQLRRWGCRAFLDERGLVPAQRWDRDLLDNLERSLAVIAVIGPSWQLRQGSDPSVDWVRTELDEAIKRKLPILPVLVGISDELKPKLAAKPEAFVLQGLDVSTELTVAEARSIVQALRRVGVSPGAVHQFDVRSSGESRAAAARGAIEALQRGERRVLVAGPPGAGRSEVLALVAAQVGASGRGDIDAAGLPELSGDWLVAGGLGTRRAADMPYGLVAVWFLDLFERLRLPGQVRHVGVAKAIVEALLDYGPDLISRGVVPSEHLLALGDEGDDVRILEARNRLVDPRQATPPQRLVSQAVDVAGELLTRLAGQPVPQPVPSGGPPAPAGAGAAEQPLQLLLVADDIDKLDSGSMAVLAKLGERLGDRIRIVASAPAGWNPKESVGALDGWCLVRLEPDFGDKLRRQIDRVGGDIDRELLEALKHQCVEPYFALPMLWHLFDQGLITEVDVAATGRSEADHGDAADDQTWPNWCWRPTVPLGQLRLPRPDVVVEALIESQFPAPQRDLLQIGALLGDPFPFDIALACVDSGAGAADDPGQRWTGLSAYDPDGFVIRTYTARASRRMVAFAHPSVRRVLLDAMSEPERRRRYRQLHGVLSVAAVRESREGDRDTAIALGQLAAQAAAHSDQLREAAVASRQVAEWAEEGLANEAAEAGYLESIRYLRRHIARQKIQRDFQLAMAEDHLVLANSCYRVARLQRLGFDPACDGKPDTAPEDPGGDLSRSAHKHLDTLLDLLGERQRQQMGGAGESGDSGPPATSAELPHADDERHVRRAVHALRAHLHYNQGLWCQCLSDSDGAQLAFLNALREAEEAGAELQSRWLLAAASTRYAGVLVEEAVAAMRRSIGLTPAGPRASGSDPQTAERDRARRLGSEALLHAERVLGLLSESATEDRQLAWPRQWALLVKARVFRHIHGDQERARLFYSQIEPELRDLDVGTVDEAVQIAYAAFRLSELDGTTGDRAALGCEMWAHLEALERRVRRAGLGAELAQARYLQALHLMVMDDAGNAARATALALLAAASASCLRAPWADRVRLLAGYVAERRGDVDAAVAWYEQVVGGEGVSSPSMILQAGRVELGNRLRVDVPLLAARINGDGADTGEQGGNGRGPGWFSVASFEADIWRISQLRLSGERYQHALAVAKATEQLLDRLASEIDPTDIERVRIREDIRRDLAVAAAIHDWYRDVEPARLLNVAREWRLRVEPSEWTNPVLLHGKLAVELVRRQYDGERRLGADRFSRIAGLVECHTVARKRADTYERLFFVADAMASRGEDPSTVGNLDDAYRHFGWLDTEVVHREGRFVDLETQWLLEPVPLQHGLEPQVSDASS